MSTAMGRVCQFSNCGNKLDSVMENPQGVDSVGLKRIAI
jgi:hypothetical protein